MLTLLHEQYLLRFPLGGRYIRDNLVKRLEELVEQTRGLPDPNVSVVIRSQNNARQLQGLLDDISKQDFRSKIEVIVVDTESTDGTIEVAKKFGARIISIPQADFSYPKALNLGFAAASHAWIFSFVDHSLLTSNQTFRIATRAASQTEIGGVWGLNLPNANATPSERLAMALGFPSRMRRPAYSATKMEPGILAANSSLYSKKAWETLGGFDESYGAGGEDSALAAAMMRAGYHIIVDPAMSVHHTHGTGFIDSLKQFRYWFTLGKPQAFSRARLANFRKELR